MSEEFDVPHCDGIKCNDFFEMGIEKFPVFDVEPEVFHQNITNDGANYRRKLVAPEGSNVDKFLKDQSLGSKRMFGLRTTDQEGNSLLKKVR